MRERSVYRFFDQARLKLTAVYAVISLCIIMMVSGAAFSAQRFALAQVEVAIDQRVVEPEYRIAAEFLQRRLEVFQSTFVRRLLLIDAFLFLGATAMSYVLSGVSLRPLRQLVQRQSEFAADVSHELRTPLTTMMMEIVAVKKTTENIPPELLKVFDSIESEVRRMKGVVSHLLLLVRGQEQYVFASVDILSLLSETVEQVRSLAKEKRVDLYFTPSQGELCVRADRERLKEVLLIVLDNAVAYTPSNGSITVSAFRRGGRIHLSVSDTGFGIPDNELPHVFDRFYRGKKSAALRESGSGLGLTIAQRIVHAHHGELRIESALNEGTTVTIILSSS